MFWTFILRVLYWSCTFIDTEMQTKNLTGLQKFNIQEPTQKILIQVWFSHSTLYIRTVVQLLTLWPPPTFLQGIIITKLLVIIPVSHPLKVRHENPWFCSVLSNSSWTTEEIREMCHFWETLNSWSDLCSSVYYMAIFNKEIFNTLNLLLKAVECLQFLSIDAISIGS